MDHCGTSSARHESGMPTPPDVNRSCRIIPGVMPYPSRCGKHLYRHKSAIHGDDGCTLNVRTSYMTEHRHVVAPHKVVRREHRVHAFDNFDEFKERSNDVDFGTFHNP